MTQTAQRQSVIRFDSFEVDLRAGELHRNGIRVKLQDKAFQLLSALLEHPGEVLSQEDLEARLWPDVEVVVPASLGEHVHRLRRALDDSAHHPRYIETVPRRGYRFIGTLAPVSPNPLQPDRTGNRFRSRLLTAALVLGGIALGAAGYSYLGAPEAVGPLPRRFSYPVEKLTVDVRTQPIVAISPDGKRIVFGADHALWLQELDQLWNPRKLPGTESDGVVRPSWSPDSRRLAYAVGRDVIRLDLPNGTPKVLTTLSGAGLVLVLWSFDGESIYVREAKNINVDLPVRQWRISVEGGELVEAPELTLAPPYLEWTGAARGLGEIGNLYLNKIAAWDGPGRRPRELGVGRMPQYAPSGHIVYQRHRDKDGIWAMPFSIDQSAPTGPPFVVAPGGKSPTVSDGGTLVYASVPEEYDQLLLLDRRGQPIRHVGGRQRYIAYPNFSPDGKKVAVWGFEYATTDDWMVDIWIHEIDRPAKSRLTGHPKVDLYPQWTPDGKAVSFSSDRTHLRDLYLRPVDSSRPATLLWADDKGKWIRDWSQDGRRALFFTGPEADLWLFDTGSNQPRPILATPAQEQEPVFSPDERYIAFTSDKSGAKEVWVCPIVNCESSIRQVSTNGGYQIRWPKRDRALYYVEGHSKMMRVEVSTEPDLSFGEPEILFESPHLWSPGSARLSFYDVTDDGEQFLVVDSARARTTKESPGVIHVWQNWAAAFAEGE